MEIRENIPLAPYTIFKIGGKARFFVEIKSSNELIEALNFARAENVPFFILGAGSNVLISDKGFDGLVIHIVDGESKVSGQRLVVGAGVMMASAVSASVKASLSGFEWGIGIPGTIGGSIRGNAGCFGGEMAQVLESVRVLEVKTQNAKRKTTTQNLKPFELNNKECQFDYRDSIFKRHPEWVILSAELKLKKGDKAEIQKKIIEYTRHRAKTQDIGVKCAGCIFKNVSWSDMPSKRDLLSKFPDFKKFKKKENIPAGFLIDSSGLKGKRLGGAYISPKHANYFVNDGAAKAEDIVKLISLAKNTVKKNYGIELEEEIQYVGF